MSTELSSYNFYHYDSEGNCKAGPVVVTSEDTTLDALAEKAHSKFSASEPYFLCSPDCADESDKTKTLVPSRCATTYGLLSGARINLVEFTDKDTTKELATKVNNTPV